MTTLFLAVIYAAFISLGLPDALLGSAWPLMYPEFQVPVSRAGVVFMIISVGTVVSSLMSNKLTRRFGTGKVTAFSVGITATALLGFSCSTSFWMLCLWAVPYGLGAGSVDAALNNYVALHYASRHMNWLHCMWGIGASVGPYIMGGILTMGLRWNMGYLTIGLLQIVLTALLFLSLPLWRKSITEVDGQTPSSELNFAQIIRIPGALESMVMFFCYCALEQTAGLWASSYLVLHKGVSSEAAAAFASMFFTGIAIGRAVSGFLTIKLNDTQMIRLGQSVIALGIAIMLFPFGQNLALAGFVLIGLGCAPIYPCVIHSTPELFGTGNSQAVIGVQMASAYIGTSLMPPLFGLVAEHISAALLPVYLLTILAVMILMYERLLKKK